MVNLLQIVHLISPISAKLAYNSINSSQRSFPVLLAVFVAGPACYYSSNKFWAVITPHRPQYTPISIKKSPPKKKNLVPIWAIQNEDGSLVGNQRSVILSTSLDLR